MMSRDWNMTLYLDGPHGERMAMTLPLDECTMSDIARIQPPSIFNMRVGPSAPSPLEQTITVLKRKEFRRDLFLEAARCLGTLLAERMEDAEGWHDASRIEPAKQQLRGRR